MKFARELRVFVILVCMFFFVVYITVSYSTFSIELMKLNDNKESGCLKPIAKKWKSCVLEKLVDTAKDKREWLLHSVSRCFNATNYTRNLKFVSTADMYGERKYFLLPKKGNNSKCSVVTLGIGGDIGAEVGLKKILPLCQFYGADPILDAGKVYNEIGTYYPVAVGNKEGNYTGSVLLNGGYIDKVVRHISFMQFLKLANLSFVDYLIMDNEGAEYGILPFFEIANHARLLPDVTICQINAELHHPFEKYNISETKFNEIVKKFVMESPYVPVAISEAPMPHHYRTTWIDISSEKCIQKYLPSCASD